MRRNDVIRRYFRENKRLCLSGARGAALERRRAFDKIDSTPEMMELGVISATICQEPHIQGSLPLKILFNYLTTGELPAQEQHFTKVEIRILENVSE